jgi:membrane protein DedA with SNARE-associated domain
LVEACVVSFQLPSVIGLMGWALILLGLGVAGAAARDRGNRRMLWLRLLVGTAIGLAGVLLTAIRLG